MKRSLLFSAVLLLLTAGCVQRNNIFYPPPTHPPEARVVVPPTLTPQQQDCLAGFTELVNDGAGSDALRAWANEARQKAGCGELRLFIDGRLVVPSPPEASVSPPASEPPSRLLVELPPAPPPQAAGPEIHLVERRIEVPVDRLVPQERIVTKTEWKTEWVRVPPPLCPACAACPGCPSPPVDRQPEARGSIVQVVTSAAIGGGLAYALLYFHILSVPGISSPQALQPGELSPEPEGTAAAAAAADDLADPRVRVRSARFGEGSG